MPRQPRNYQEQTHASPYWIVRWPHRRRFELAEAEIVRRAPAALLDYGAGDAHLLQRLGERGALPPTVAYEPVDDYAAQARATLDREGLHEGVRIVTTIEDCAGESFDAIACLGVLEHMPLLQRELFYDLCDKTLSATGVGIVDVPVETDPALLVKEVARRTLKRREREYAWPELLRRSLGRGEPDPARFDRANTDTWIQFHTGFDHRILRDEIAARFEIVREFASPLPRLPAAINQEYLIVFRRRR